MAPSILFVCTGNICRSPMAEYLLAHRLESAVAESSVVVSSAGVQAMVGDPAHPETVRVLAQKGIDASGFRARYLSSDLITSHDLVVGLSRSHRDGATAAVPTAWRRIVALRELDEYIVGGGGNDLASLRITGDRNRPALDIADPMGKPAHDFDRLYAELDPMITRLATWLL